MTREDAEAFEFHVRELRADVSGLILDVARVRGLDAIDELAGALSTIAVAVEHDLDHHSAAALDLVRGIDPEGGAGARRRDDEIAAESDERWRRADESRLESTDSAIVDSRLGADLAVLGARLAEVAAELGSIDASRPDEASSSLQKIRTDLQDATAAAFAAVQASTWLARRTEKPDARAEREANEEVMRPLATRTHAEAARLQACPSCGANLDTSDRTTTGSYCERCRTRWVLPQNSEKAEDPSK